MTTRTQASRSAGRAPSTTWIARMPPAEPTTATTWTVGGSILPAIRSRKEAADRLRLLASLLRDSLEASAAAVGTRLADPLGEPLRHLRPLLQGAQSRSQGDRDRPSRPVLAQARECCAADRRVSAVETHISVAILSHVALFGKTSDRGRDRRRDIDERQHAVGVVARQRVRRQRCEERIVGVLDKDAAAAGLDCGRAVDAVAAGAGEDDRHRPALVRTRG